MIRSIAFTVYPVKDVEASRRFYEETLLLKLDCVVGGGHWVEYDVAGATFAITDMNDKSSPGKGGAVAFEVDDLNAAVARIQPGSIVAPPFETPVCHIAIVADPDGNEVILHKRK